MKNHNIFKYSVLAIALILSSLRLHPCLNILSIYFACLFIAINLNKKKLIQYSLFLFTISIILKVVLNVNNHYFSENFNGENTTERETITEGETTTEEEKTKGETTTEGETTAEGETTHKSDTPNEDASSNNGGTSKINLTETLNHNNLTEEEKDKLNYTDSIDDQEKNEEFNSNDMNIITPAQAQRELYRLVDTTSLLTKTMNELSPILSEGKNIMNTLEQLNLTSKLQK